MLDFDGIVLSTLQNTFSRTIIVKPIVSQQGNGVAYSGRGVYATGPVDLPVLGDLVTSDQKSSVWIRVSEYLIPPVEGDHVEIPAHQNYPAAGNFEVIDVDSWADGKAVLTLKRLLAREN